MSYGDTHPSRKIHASDSSSLKGKNIALGITGSVAAFHSPIIARELIRHGANIIPVMSRAALDMIGKDLMWWATGNEPITLITGDLEHIRMAGVMNDPIDLMLIAPCTTNTVGKLTVGIADTPVTLIASSLMGKQVPLLINPVAHEDLINSPAIKNALDSLRKMGVGIIEPVRSEGKAKVPELKDMIFSVMDALITKDLNGKRIIISGGPTREYIDEVRYITNDASGRTSIEFAKQAHLRGADVTLVLGPTNIQVPTDLNVRAVVSSKDMTDMVVNLLDNTNDAILILSAAMADFTPSSPITGKIKSGKPMDLRLDPTIKLSDLIKKRFPSTRLILFKAEYNVEKDTLIERAKTKLTSCDADLIIANDLSEPGAGFQTITNHVFVIGKDGQREVFTNKSALFNEIYDILLNGF